MRRWSPVAVAVAPLALALTAGIAFAQPSGSSPEAALEAFNGQHSPSPKFVEVEEAKAQMIVPACSHAVSTHPDEGHALEGCIRTMEDSLGWTQSSSFSTCSDEGIETSRLQACSSAISTFLLHHESEDDAEYQATASLALMKDLCSGATLCGLTPDT